MSNIQINKNTDEWVGGMWIKHFQCDGKGLLWATLKLDKMKLGWNICM